jgi:DNA-binding transcriptional MerR regulator
MPRIVDRLLARVVGSEHDSKVDRVPAERLGSGRALLFGVAHMLDFGGTLLQASRFQSVESRMNDAWLKVFGGPSNLISELNDTQDANDRPSTTSESSQTTVNPTELQREVQEELDRLEEAEAGLRAQWRTTDLELAASRPDALASRQGWASLLVELGRLDEAEAEYRALLEARTRILGPDHPDTLASRHSRAGVLMGMGRSEEADAEHRNVFSLWESKADQERDLETASIGYRGPTACAAAGITYRQLDYWARTGLVQPSVRPARGSNSQRLYSFSDILILKIVKRLLDTGVSLQQIRAAVANLRDHDIRSLVHITLMSDGESVYECASPDEVVELIQSGQGVFGIALGRVWKEVEGALEELPAERAATPGYGTARSGLSTDSQADSQNMGKKSAGEAS